MKVKTVEVVVKFVSKNWKNILKGAGAVVGVVGGVILGKQVIDDTCFDEYELGELVRTAEEITEEEEF